MSEGDARPLLSHERLDVFRLSRELAIDMHVKTSSMSSADRFGLASRIRRASVSIPANIAEGAARSSRKESVRFLAIARGSSAELRVLLDIAHATGQIDKEVLLAGSVAVDRISSMISGLMRRNQAR